MIIACFDKIEPAHCGDGAAMTPDFLDEFLLAMMPSMLTVAWLAWRADVRDLDL